MRNRKIPNIRLDKSNVDAPTINRALDNILNNVNTFIGETVEAVAAIEAQPAAEPVTIVGGNDITVTESPANTFTIDYSGSPSGVNINGGTGISVVEAPPGTFTIDNTGALLSGPAQTFTNDNTFAGAVTTFAGAIVQTNAGTTFTNNGTIANVGSIQGGVVNATTYQNLPVDDIQAGSGIAVTESPAGTFTIINTNQGGGGGGGQILYLNGNIAGDAPLPVAGTKEFGQAVQPTGTNSGAITLPNTGAYVTINGFVTDLNIPDVLTIPAGIWDFNVFMATDSGQPDEVEARIRLYVWDGTTSTLIGTSNQVLITNSTTVSQYTLSVIVAEQITTATDRIYALLDAHVLGSNSHTVTAYYGNTYPSHAHSTLPYPYVQTIVAGTAISAVESPTGTYTITNTAPDQVVSLTDGTGISITGTYPNFTITNTDPASTIDVTSGTGVTVTESPTGTFSVAIGQAVGTTNNVTFNNVTATNQFSGLNYRGNGNIFIAPTPSALQYGTTVQGGQNSAGVGGQTTLLGGTSLNAGSNGGAIRVDGGTGGAGALGGNVNIGTIAAGGVTIGRTGIFTTVNGTLSTTTIAPNNNFSLAPTAFTTGLTTTINGGAGTAGAGGTTTINGGAGTTGGGAITLRAGATTSGTAGATNIIGGDTTADSTTAGNAVMRGGNASGLTTIGGSVFIDAGTGTTTNGRIAIGQSFSGGTPTSIRIGNNTNSVTEINGTQYTDNVYCFAESSTAAVTIGSTASPTTMVYASVSQNGISLNTGTGQFTVPATGIYQIQISGIFRGTTVPASTYWTNWELYNVTTSTIIDSQALFRPIAAAGSAPVAIVAGDSFLINLVSAKTLNSTDTYSIRCKTSQATANTFVSSFEPVLATGTTSRAGQRFRLSIQRKT